MKNQNPIIEKLLAHIFAECDPVNREAAFDSMLDECYSFDAVGGPFAHMCPSRVLAECDPTAYRCGVNDYADGQDWSEIGTETYQDDDIARARDEFCDGLRDELQALETELEDEQAADEPDAGEIARLESAIAAKNDEIEACENYAF